MICEQFTYDAVFGLQFNGMTKLDNEQKSFEEKLNGSKKRRGKRFAIRTLAKPVAIGRIKKEA